MMKLLLGMRILALLAFIEPLSAMAQERPVRVLAYGASNTWGWQPRIEGFPVNRYRDGERWAGVLQQALGSDYTVIVDGLVGRTTNLDRRDPVGVVPKEAFNGKRDLAAAIARNMPLDAVVIMLGTNDLQAGVERAPDAVAAAAIELAEVVHQSKQLLFTSYSAPKVLLVAPPPMGDTSRTPLSTLFGVSELPSHRLGAAFSTAGERSGVPVFDSARAVPRADGPDGIHMTARSHNSLGMALVPELRGLLAREWVGPRKADAP